MTLKEDRSLERSAPKINGLVLAGGKSVRMQQAKDQMIYHDKEQRYYAADLLKPFCDEVFISCRESQVTSLHSNYTALTDTFLNMGPLGGILSALRFNRSKAWLVVACDMPLLDQESLQFLVENRDARKVATTYESPFDQLPEPLITIWEPNSYAGLLNHIATGNTCPRKMLINSDAAILKPQNADALRNVNTPQDAEEVRKILKF